MSVKYTALEHLNQASEELEQAYDAATGEPNTVELRALIGKVMDALAAARSAAEWGEL